MRSVLLAILLVIVTSFRVSALSMQDAEFESSQQQQVRDYRTLVNLHNISDSILIKYSDISEATNFERLIILLNVKLSFNLIAFMRERGEIIFSTVENDYNRFCLQSQRASCDTYKESYTKIISVTLFLATVYSRVEKRSKDVVANFTQ